MTYRQAIANLSGDDMLVISLEDGEAMRNVRARVRRAAHAVGRHVLLTSWDKEKLLVGLPPPTALVTVLSSVFPTLTVIPSPIPECWISRVLAERLDSLFYPQPLRHIARALEAVDRCGELARLTQRFAQEHPLHRSHRRDYDEQFITCLTEGCALAWADARQFGQLHFTSQIEGAPDIQADSGLWIEAKSIGPSKEDRQLMESMRASKEPLVGTPRMPAAGLWRKFDHVFIETRRRSSIGRASVRECSSCTSPLWTYRVGRSKMSSLRCSRHGWSASHARPRISASW